MFSLIPWRSKSTPRQGSDGEVLTTGRSSDPFLRMRDEFDEMFDRTFQGWPSIWQEFGRGWHWGLECQDQDDAFVVRAEAPGFEPDDFDVQVQGNQLVMRASHKEESEGKDGGERSWQQQEFYRSISLPAGVDPAKVDARYRNGVLTISLPRTEPVKGKRIAIKG